MSTAPVNGQQQIQLTAEQLAAMLLIESLLSTMQVTVNQLGGFVKYLPAANMVANAGAVLGKDYERMKADWQRSVVIAPAGALSVIDGKKTH
jgi:hypothetical protein